MINRISGYSLNKKTDCDKKVPFKGGIIHANGHLYKLRPSQELNILENLAALIKAGKCSYAKNNFFQFNVSPSFILELLPDIKTEKRMLLKIKNKHGKLLYILKSEENAGKLSKMYDGLIKKLNSLKDPPDNSSVNTEKHPSGTFKKCFTRLISQLFS